MVHPNDQRRIRNQEPVFVQQLDLVEIKDDEEILEAIKRKFQADANRQQWIRDEIVSEEDLEDYEDRLREFHRLISCREEQVSDTEEAKMKFGRETLRKCQFEAAKTPVSPVVPYVGYGAGMLHTLADNLRIGWHPDWRRRLGDAESEVDDGN